MADQTKNDDTSEPVDRWKGHIKNVAPNADFEAEVKAAELPAKQQSEREAKILHENMVSASPKHEDAIVGPAMPPVAANSVYPDADRGLVSSQSQTPRFQFDTSSQPDSDESAPKIGKQSFLKRLFGR